VLASFLQEASTRTACGYGLLEQSFMKITMIGTGYVGLVTGTCLAESGNEVVCVDKDEQKIATLESGQLTIYEPGLLELVRRNRREGRLRFTTSLAEGVEHGQLIFLAVGTPQAADGAADLSALWAVADGIAEYAKGAKVVVVKSTVPVGTNRALAERLAARGARSLDVASNPEFLKEGAAVDDFMRPDRVVVGVRRPEVGKVLHDLYAPFLRTEHPFLAMSPESAEMTKYVANAMLATKISFINEMANLCERMGADINDVRRGIGHDARIGFQFLFPGSGYGGSCFEGDETVFVSDGTDLVAQRLQSLFERSGKPLGEAAQVVVPTGLRVLAFDMQGWRPVLAEVMALTKRPYKGTMVRLRTGMGRSLRVTADHPVVLWTEGGFKVVQASSVQVGDRLAAVCELPQAEPASQFDLVEMLRGTELAEDVHVAPTDDSFTARYKEYKSHITRDWLNYPEEIKRHNRMPLRLYHHLSERGLFRVPAEKLQLYTAKGAGTRVNAVIPLDADLARLCGYYLAEGFISCDVGRAGAVRHRIGFSFHENEKEYITDVRRILARWGMKYIEQHSTSAITTLVSSRVFAWLLRDVLQCGIGSEDKALPRLGFRVAPELQREMVRGAFSGDGAVTTVKKGRNFMLEYATVSKPLADAMALLLQSLGIIVSIRRRWMNKSKHLAYLLRVSGHAQLEAMKAVFGEKHRSSIESLLDGYQRHIRQHGFTRHGSYATFKVRAVEAEEVKDTVYSLETSTGTVVVSSGLIAHNCFPKDVRALTAMSRELNVPLRLMEAVDEVNEAQKRVLYRKIQAHYGSALKDKTLAVWGLAFKPRTDDIREAPALVLIDALLAEGVRLRVHDPEALANVRALYGDKLIYCDRPYGALEGADGLAIVTEWQEFRNPDFEVMRRLLREPVIFDGRNLYEPLSLTAQGFSYYAIGRFWKS
jgi:UDPglucose 6-dehydrogenase